MSEIVRLQDCEVSRLGGFETGRLQNYKPLLSHLTPLHTTLHTMLRFLKHCNPTHTQPLPQLNSLLEYKGSLPPSLITTCYQNDPLRCLKLLLYFKRIPEFTLLHTQHPGIPELLKGNLNPSLEEDYHLLQLYTQIIQSTGRSKGQARNRLIRRILIAVGIVVVLAIYMRLSSGGSSRTSFLLRLIRRIGQLIAPNA